MIKFEIDSSTEKSSKSGTNNSQEEQKSGSEQDGEEREARIMKKKSEGSEAAISLGKAALNYY